MEDDGTDVDVWDTVLEHGACGLAGTAVGLVVGVVGNLIRSEFGLKPKMETIIALPTAAIGGITKNAGLIGGSIGLILSDVICDVETWEMASDNIELAEAQESDWFVRRYDIPDWLPEVIIYKLLGDKLCDIITNPSYNPKLKQRIPAGREHPDVIRQARIIVKESGIHNGREFDNVARALQIWVHNNINYVRDPRWMDTFAHPWRTLEQSSEDCDGHSLLLASMLEALGAQSCLILYDQKGTGNGYNHITSGLVYKGQVYPLETVNQQTGVVPWGWWPPHHRKKVIYV